MMPDMENVIEKVTTEIEDALSGDLAKAGHVYVMSLNELKDKALKDALALLKEREPRVMKLEDVKAFDWDYCYLEEERLPGNEYRAVCGDYMLTCITWPYVTSMRIQHGDESYGKKWRCWTAKPTDEQRKAVKWDHGML